MRTINRSIIAVFGILIVSIILIFSFYKPNTNIELETMNDSVLCIGFVEMWGNYSRSVALFEEIIKPEVNQYAEEIGSGLRFDFIVLKAEDSPSSLERVQEMDVVGVRYVIGSNCVACTSYSYIEDNDMMLVSSRSRQPGFNRVDEHMFRVCPHDGDQGIALARVLESKNITNVAVLRRGDSRADAIFEVFNEEYVGDVLVDIRYPGESTIFRDELASIESSISELEDSSHVGLLVLSNAEVEAMVDQAQSYLEVMSVPWFGADTTAKLDESPFVDSIEGFEAVELYSVTHSVEYDEKWDQLRSHYFDVTGVYPESVVGYDYDAAWLYALTLLEADSFERSVLAEALPKVGAGYRGVTGFIVLDVAGDRVNACYDVWGYVLDDGVTVCQRVGYIDGSIGSVFWLE